MITLDLHALVMPVLNAFENKFNFADNFVGIYTVVTKTCLYYWKKKLYLTTRIITADRMFVSS